MILSIMKFLLVRLEYRSISITANSLLYEHFVIQIYPKIPIFVNK